MGVCETGYTNQCYQTDSALIPIDPSILDALKSLCKISIPTINRASSGFMIKLVKNQEEFFCLVTNEHVITKEMIK